MQNFNIKLKNKVKKSFRTDKIKAQYDYSESIVAEEFSGTITLPEKWNIGLIVGGSGTGKTTIAKNLFKNNFNTVLKYNNKSVIDNMPKHCTVEDITKTFYNVGFGSVPSWLKPYKVLSNGEKMRVDLARSILEKDFIVFDEFTSVVDRDVAKTTCVALSKSIKKNDKQFVAVSCHHDVIEFLQPDWVFDTDKMQCFFQYRQSRCKHFMLENVDLTNGENLSVITI